MTRLQGYEIHALEFGSEEAEEELVLIHGLAGSSRWWNRNLAELAESYRVIVPDLIGFGRSPRPRGRLPSPATVAETLADWLERLDCGRVHLVGHSMGGQLSIHLAARYPERVSRLVLVDAAGIPRPLGPASLLRFATEVAPLWRWGDPTFLPVIAGDAWTAGPRTLLQSIYHILRDDVRPLLPRIQTPTLVLWGERDNLIPLRHAVEMRRKIPESQLAVLRGAAHNPMVDRPADFNRLVLGFLDGETVGR